MIQPFLPIKSMSYALREGVWDGRGVWNGRGYLKLEGVFEMGGGIWKKIPLLCTKIVEFGKIVVIEFIDMSGVIDQTFGKHS